MSTAWTATQKICKPQQKVGNVTMDWYSTFYISTERRSSWLYSRLLRKWVEPHKSLLTQSLMTGVTNILVADWCQAIHTLQIFVTVGCLDRKWITITAHAIQIHYDKNRQMQSQQFDFYNNIKPTESRLAALCACLKICAMKQQQFHKLQLKLKCKQSDEEIRSTKCTVYAKRNKEDEKSPIDRMVHIVLLDLLSAFLA